MLIYRLTSTPPTLSRVRLPPHRRYSRFRFNSGALLCDQREREEIFTTTDLVLSFFVLKTFDFVCTLNYYADHRTKDEVRKLSPKEQLRDAKSSDRRRNENNTALIVSRLKRR